MAQLLKSYKREGDVWLEEEGCAHFCRGFCGAGGRESH